MLVDEHLVATAGRDQAGQPDGNFLTDGAFTRIDGQTDGVSRARIVMAAWMPVFRDRERRFVMGVRCPLRRVNTDRAAEDLRHHREGGHPFRDAQNQEE